VAAVNDLMTGIAPIINAATSSLTTASRLRIEVVNRFNPNKNMVL
jgi:hypothetical protein